jgi:hypothetical protein
MAFIIMRPAAADYYSRRPQPAPNQLTEMARYAQVRKASQASEPKLPFCKYLAKQRLKPAAQDESQVWSSTDGLPDGCGALRNPL